MWDAPAASSQPFFAQSHPDLWIHDLARQILGTAIHVVSSMTSGVIRSSRMRPAVRKAGLAKVVRVTHDLQTCRIPLPAVSAYYHRNLNVGPEPSRPLLRDQDLTIDVGVPRPVEIAAVESAAHTAYLEPRTGAGFLLLPTGETDISAEDGFAGLAWPSEWNDVPAAGLSLQSADLVCLLDRLALSG